MTKVLQAGGMAMDEIPAFLNEVSENIKDPNMRIYIPCKFQPPRIHSVLDCGRRSPLTVGSICYLRPETGDTGSLAEKRAF